MNQKELLSKYLSKLGSKGGKKAASNMTKQQRIERARKAGQTRAANAAKKRKK